MSEGDKSAVTAIGVGYTLDTLSHTLARDGRETQLSPLASRLLQLLATRPGEVFERTEIIEALWRGDWLVGDPALHRLVSELRRAAGDDAKRPALIQTVPRRGYRLVVETGGAASPAASTVAAPAWWPVAWRLANTTLFILIGGTAAIMLLALLIRHFR